jgi:zinc transporter ZupT
VSANERFDFEERSKLRNFDEGWSNGFFYSFLIIGLATFVAALQDPKVGAVLAIAIAIHNIPEGT